MEFEYNPVAPCFNQPVLQLLVYFYPFSRSCLRILFTPTRPVAPCLLLSVLQILFTDLVYSNPSCSSLFTFISSLDLVYSNPSCSSLFNLTRLVAQCLLQPVLQLLVYFNPFSRSCLRSKLKTVFNILYTWVFLRPMGRRYHLKTSLELNPSLQSTPAFSCLEDGKMSEFILFDMFI